ncbi:hypothetical protein ACHAP5_010116 [Fusarium lateritium]
MAEALGVIASVATIASLTKPTIKLVKSLRGIAKHDDPIANEIRRIATQIEFSATSVDVAVRQLKGHCATLQKMPEAPTGVVQYISKNKSVNILLRGTKDVARQMRNAQHALKSVSGQHGFWKRIKWYVWNKVELDSLFPGIQQLCLCLSFVCPILKMEIDQYIKQRSSPEVKGVIEEEIESLRDQLKLSEERYRKLRDDREFATNYGSGFDPEFQNIATSLLRLAESMRHTGAVPQTTEAPAHTPLASREPVSKISHRTRTGDRRSPRSEAEIKLPPRQSINNRSPTLRRRTSTIHQVLEAHKTPLDGKSRNLEVPREPSTPSSRTSSTVRDSGSSLPSQSVQTPQTPRSPQTPDMPEPLRTSSSRLGEDKGTYILESSLLRISESSGKDISIKFTFDTTVQDNFISIKQAAELKLPRQGLGQQDYDYVHQIDSPSGAKIVEKVLGMRWRRREWSKSIPLDLWIEECYPQTGEHMVLGKTFVQAVQEQEQGGQ